MPNVTSAEVPGEDPPAWFLAYQLTVEERLLALTASVQSRTTEVEQLRTLCQELTTDLEVAPCLDVDFDRRLCQNDTKSDPTRLSYSTPGLTNHDRNVESFPVPTAFALSSNVV